MAGSFQLLAATLTSALVMGFLPALWRGFRSGGNRNPELSDTAVSRLEKTCLFLSLPCLLAAGWAVDAWGAHDILFVGSVLAALASAVLGTRTTYESMRWLVVVVAAATACLSVGATAAMPHAFWGWDDPAASINLGFVAVGIGYLLLPRLADGLCRKLGFSTGMMVLAVFCLLPAGFATFTARAELAATAAATEVVAPLSNPVIWLAALSAIFCFAFEFTLCSWTGDYLKNLGHSPRQAAWHQAGFWTIFLLSRFITGQYLVPGYERWFILVLVAVSAVTLGNLAGAYGPTNARGLLVLAAAFGPVIPSLLGAILPLSDRPGMALAIVYACGGAGMLVLGPALATSNQGRPVQVGMRAPLAVMLLMAVPVLVLALLR